jgi:hypothetical protein
MYVMEPSAPAETWSGPVNPTQVSARYDISLHTLAQWRHRGYGPPYYRIGKHVRYIAEECDTWFADQRVKGVA